jgi:hypothetical protein
MLGQSSLKQDRHQMMRNPTMKSAETNDLAKLDRPVCNTVNLHPMFIKLTMRTS